MVVDAQAGGEEVLAAGVAVRAVAMALERVALERVGRVLA